MMSAAPAIAIAFSASQSCRSQGLMARSAHQTAKTRLRMSRYLRWGMAKRRSAQGLEHPHDGQVLAERQESHEAHRELRLHEHHAADHAEHQHAALAGHQEAQRLAAARF